MLKQPFSGKELFGIYEFQMGRLTISDTIQEREVIITEAWDGIGKTKKAAWYAMAKMINIRMEAEKES